MNGVLVIDKPPGWTSHDVVAKIRNVTRIKKVGHTGTLDPFATGVLPLTLGRATRLTNYFLSTDKIYRGVIRFGFATTTFDIDGDPLSEDTHPVLDSRRLEEVFQKYLGLVKQTVPAYSAKKIRGRPMYSYARKGIKVQAGTKEVHIKAGQSLVIEAGMELTIKVGGSFVKIDAQGVTIVGAPLVKINSGGAPGSGSGSAPVAPQPPQAAKPHPPGQ